MKINIYKTSNLKNKHENQVLHENDTGNASSNFATNIKRICAN